MTANQVDLLYVAHNRADFTRATFTQLRAATDWNRVARLHVLDDNSTDGSREWLSAQVADLHAHQPLEVRFVSRRFGGPVAAMNDAAANLATGVLGKVDNDFVVCAGWLDELLAVLDRSPDLDVLGLEAGFCPPLGLRGVFRDWRPDSHVGGIGLFRASVFRRGRLTANGERGRHGWTAFQQRHASCGWLRPDLPCFALDRVPVEPWLLLTDRYVRQGLQRRWPMYPVSWAPYWEWFTEREAAGA